MLRSTVHSTKQHENEIANTINLLHVAIHNTLSGDFCGGLKKTLEDIQATKRTSEPDSPTFTTSRHAIQLRRKQIIEQSQYRNIQELFQNDDIQLYHIAFIGTTRFTTREFTKTKKSDDSCILYRFKTQQYVGFINSIVLVNGNG